MAAACRAGARLSLACLGGAEHPVSGPTPGEETPRRLLAIADSDSYLKWSAATLGALPPRWQQSQVVVENPVMPSAAQIQPPAPVLCRFSLRTDRIAL